MKGLWHLIHLFFIILLKYYFMKKLTLIICLFCFGFAFSQKEKQDTVQSKFYDLKKDEANSIFYKNLDSAKASKYKMLTKKVPDQKQMKIQKSPAVKPFKIDTLKAVKPKSSK